MSLPIEQCASGHSYLSGGNKCPWCEIERLRAEVAELRAGRTANMPTFVKRALAELQALREAPPSETWQIMRRADELLEGKK